MMQQTQKQTQGWEWKKLGEICEIYNGSTPLRKEDKFWEKGTIPWFTIDDIREQGRVIRDTKQKITDLALQKTSVKLLPANSVLLCCTASIGEYAITKIELTTNQQFNGLVIKEAYKERVLPDYLFYVISKIGPELNRYAGFTSFKFVAVKNLSLIEIPVPPLETQRQIVAVLERAEKLVQRREQVNNEMKSVIQSIFVEMFGDPTKNGKGYPIKNLDEISLKITDGTHITPKYTEMGVPFLRVTDITNSNESKKFISEEEHKELVKRCKPEKGDILYTKNGTIGIAKTIDWDYDFSIFVSLCLIKPNKELILPKYLEVFLNTPFALSQALQHSKKGTITNLHLIEIKKILVPVPPIKKQEEFLRIVEKIEIIKNHQINSTKEINTLFDALMQKAFNGEIK